MGSGWVGVYEAATAGRLGTDNTTWFMLGDSPQPDVALFVRPEFGGACRYDGDFVSGPAELVIEVSATTQSYDFGPKLRLYREAGVREYLSIVKTGSKIVWRHLRDREYFELQPDGDGIYRSIVFPGLWLNPARNS